MVKTVAVITAKLLVKIMFFEVTFPMTTATEIHQNHFPEEED
jgi:hypothetical protein